MLSILKKMHEENLESDIFADNGDTELDSDEELDSDDETNVSYNS